MRHDTRLEWVGVDEGEWYCMVEDCPHATVTRGTWDEATRQSGNHAALSTPRGDHYLFDWQAGGYQDAGWDATWLADRRRDYEAALT